MTLKVTLQLQLQSLNIIYKLIEKRDYIANEYLYNNILMPELYVFSILSISRIINMSRAHGMNKKNGFLSPFKMVAATA